MLRIDPAEHVYACNFRSVFARRLVRAEVTSVTKYGEDVSLNGIREFWFGAGWRPKMAGVTGPVLRVLENIEEVPLGHPGMKFVIKFRQSFGVRCLIELLQMRRAIFIDAQLAVGGKSFVDLRSKSSSVRP